MSSSPPCETIEISEEFSSSSSSLDNNSVKQFRSTLEQNALMRENQEQDMILQLNKQVVVTLLDSARYLVRQ